MSFAAEIKDFQSSMAAGQKLAANGDERERTRAATALNQAQTETINQKNNDTEGQAAELALKKASVRAKTAGIGLINDRHDLIRAQLKAMADSVAKQNEPSPAFASPPPGATAPITPAAVPVEQPAAPGPQSAVAPEQAPEGAPVEQSAANGGLIKKFADGGAVAADDTEDETDDGDVGTSGSTDFSSRARDLVRAGVVGAKAGLTYGSAAHGFHMPDNAVGGTSPSRSRAAKSWVTGADAAPMESMDQIRKWVDPEGKMADSERNLAGIGAVYQFYANKGDYEHASKLAFQMTQSLRVAQQKYAAIAANCFEKGDLSTACHAAMKSYAHTPDAKDIKMEPTKDGQIAYTYTDSLTGKLMKQGIASPKDMAAAAMGFAKDGFDQSLQASIQGTAVPDAPKPAVDPNSLPMKAADKTAALKGVDTAFESQNPAPEDPKAAPKYSADATRDIKSAAFRVSGHTNNPRITHDEAVAAASKIADPTITSKEGFAPKKVDGGYQVKFGTRAPVFIPENDFDTLMAHRTAAMDAKKAKPTEGEGFSVKGAIEGVKSAASGALDWVNGDLAKWAKANPEASARIKSAIDKGGQAAADAKAYLEKEMAKPNLFKGIANGPGEGKI